MSRPAPHPDHIPDRLQELLTGAEWAAAAPAPGRWRPLPPATDRPFWESAPADARKALAATLDTVLAQPWTVLPATGFLAYARTGDRETFERLYFARRTRLAAAAVATALHGPRPDLVDEVIDGVWLLCDEAGWCLPAHEREGDDHGPLPDRGRPTLDLFAAETGGLLAWLDVLLGDTLELHAPLVRERMRRTVRERVVEPFLERDDWWWLGLRGEFLNNWTTWIISHVLPCAYACASDTATTAAVTERAVGVLDRYLDCCPPDGACDEGIAYWRRSAASLFESLETLSGACAATFEDAGPEVFSLPLVRALARYPLATHIAGDRYVNFADGPARQPATDAGLLHRYGRRVGDPDLTRHAAAMREGADLFRFDRSPDMSLHRVLAELADTHWHSATADGFPLPAHTVLTGVQVVTARQSAGTTDGFHLAAKGGHNGEPHNHNDVGTFTAALDGVPLLVDAGVETYSRATFSSERYSIWTMRSSWHNAPQVDGHEQAPGSGHAARDVEVYADEDGAGLALDLAATWDEAAGVRSWRRSVRLDRAAGRIVVDDTWDLDRPARDLVLNLMTPQPVTEVPGALLLGDGPVRARLDLGGTAFAVSLDERMLDDPRMTLSWGPVLRRIRLTHPDPGTAGSVRLTLSRLSD
ncbi:heparinase II/III domain-containing protein [Streptomyces sp. bgisy091]|uniref:heparinase II/III domain-containing protein n=1 Tax=Streptomyces sp. bgisy091 TaxID=3413778 RepID=UPI003D72E455